MSGKVHVHVFIGSGFGKPDSFYTVEVPRDDVLEYMRKNTSPDVLRGWRLCVPSEGVGCAVNIPEMTQQGIRWQS